MLKICPCSRNSGREFSEEGKGKILALRLEHIDAKLDAFAKRAVSIIRSSGIDYPVTPDSIADIYEENQRRMLEWQGILEKTASMKHIRRKWQS